MSGLSGASASSEPFAPRIQGLSSPARSYEPNKALLYGPTLKERIHTRHLTYFSDDDNAVSIDGGWYYYVINYIQIVFDKADRSVVRSIWKKYYDLPHIKEITQRNSNKPVLTKSGLLILLQSWRPTTSEEMRMRNWALECMQQFIAEDSSNIANVGAQAASSVPIQQSYSEVQAQEASPMQVLALCAHDMRIAQLKTDFAGERERRAGARA